MRYRKPRVLVIGDLIIDEWYYVESKMYNPEGATLIVEGNPNNKGASLGGAGNAAAILKAFGASVKLMAQLSKDNHGELGRRLLLRERLSAKHVQFSDDWRIPMKRRYVNEAGVVIFRHDEELDVEQNMDVAGESFDAELCNSLISKADCVAIFDYDKGYIAHHAPDIVKFAKENDVPIIVGAKPHRLSDYVGADIVKLNAKETAEYLDVEMDDISNDPKRAAELVCELMESRAAIITAGSSGSACAVMTDNGDAYSFLVPAVPCFPSVKNCVGAGDAFLAGFVFDFVSRIQEQFSFRVKDAVLTGSETAARYLQDGLDAIHPAIPVTTRHDLYCGKDSNSKIYELHELDQLCQLWRDTGEQVVFTNGCFDLLHAGHLHLLEQAKRRGTKLVVAVNTDASVRALKGSERPVQKFTTRAAIVAALQFVDAVVSLEEEDFIGHTALRSMITTLEPDVLVKGSEYSEGDIVGWEEVTGRRDPGTVWRCPMLPENSTTELINKVKNRE